MHHAYLIIGTFESARSLLPSHVAPDSPDCQIMVHDTFTIADARSLRHHASLSAVGNTGRTFVLQVASMTTEAQQALLKLFEDPAARSVFYVITEEEEQFLPTFRSRCILWRAHDGDGPSFESTTTFLNFSYKDRYALIQDLASKKDTARMEELLHGLEHHAHQTHKAETLRETLALTTYRLDRGASLKMILEHLALSFPVMEKVR